jgi:hypothetical protein
MVNGDEDFSWFAGRKLNGSAFVRLASRKQAWQASMNGKMRVLLQDKTTAMS